MLLLGSINFAFLASYVVKAELSDDPRQDLFQPQAAHFVAGHQCPLRVRSRHRVTSTSCRLFPSKREFSARFDDPEIVLRDIAILKPTLGVASDGMNGALPSWAMQTSVHAGGIASALIRAFTALSRTVRPLGLRQRKPLPHRRRRNPSSELSTYVRPWRRQSVWVS